MKLSIYTEKAPSVIGPYSQAIKLGNLIFVSGQLPISPETGLIEGGIEEQTQMSLANLSNILEAAGSSLDKVLKTTVYLDNINDFAAMNKVYSTFFKTAPPARSAFEVANLPQKAKVEIEAIAYID